MVNKVSATNICSFFLFVILILGQFILFSGATKGPASFGGDEPGYISKAEYFFRHGVLPKATRQLAH
jgi:hypothetical protein